MQWHNTHMHQSTSMYVFFVSILGDLKSLHYPGAWFYTMTQYPNAPKYELFSQSIIFAAGYKETNLSNSYTLGFWEAFWLMTSFCSFYTDSYCSQKIQNFYCLQDYKLDHPNLQAWLKHLPHWLVFEFHWFFSVFVFSNVATHRIFFSELVKRRPN